jgi:hypothetical protein
MVAVAVNGGGCCHKVVVAVNGGGCCHKAVVQLINMGTMGYIH